MSERPKRKRNIIITIISVFFLVPVLIVTIIVWLFITCNPEDRVPRQAKWETVVARIHAGEKVEHPDRPFNVKPRGESGHEDVFFRQSHFLLFGMAIDSSVGYLYSEDDICDVSFGEGRIVSMDFITENWYFIRVEY